MYNLQQRANGVVAFSITALFSLLGAVAFLSLFLSSAPVGKVLVKELRVYHDRYDNIYWDYRRSDNEFASVTFDIEADLTSLFNWNTKQVFVAVIAEYETPSHNRNQAVLWDAIIQDKQKAKISRHNQRNKYSFIDISTKWRDTQANFSLYWDVTPYVGLLQNGQSKGSEPFKLPKVTPKAHTKF